MNDPLTEIKRWGVIVIQSIPNGEIQTGANLYNDIIRYKTFIQPNTFCHFYDVKNKVEFIDTISCILNGLERGDIITLHIETHGANQGIALASGELIKWGDFYDLIRPINIKIGHLLLLVMSMCKSIAMISSIAVEKRAPYRAFVCTIREMLPDELYNGFIRFYENYFNLLDIGKAIESLQKELIDNNGFSPFQILSAESVFDETLSTTRNIDELCIIQLNRLGKPITSDNITSMRSQIHDIFKDLHSKHSVYYNFRDLY